MELIFALMLSHTSSNKNFAAVILGLLFASIPTYILYVARSIEMSLTHSIAITAFSVLVYLFLYGRDNFFWLLAKMTSSDREQGHIVLVLFNRSGLGGSIGTISRKINGKEIQSTSKGYISYEHALKYAQRIA